MASMIAKVAAATAAKKVAAATANANANATVAVIPPTKAPKAPVTVDADQFAVMKEVVRNMLGDAAADAMGTKFSVDRCKNALGGKKADVQASLKKLDISFDASHDAEKLATTFRDHVLANLAELRAALGMDSPRSSDDSGASSSQASDASASDASGDDGATKEANAKPVKADTTIAVANARKHFGDAIADKLQAEISKTKTKTMTVDAIKAAFGEVVGPMRKILKEKKGIEVDNKEEGKDAKKLAAWIRDNYLLVAA